MFTGIVQEVGVVDAVAEAPNGRTLAIRCGVVTEGLRLGDSVAVDGCCLTAIEIGGDRAVFEAMGETLARTTIGGLEPGERVNLEGAVRAGDPIGGHVVQGHVDGVGGIVAERHDGIARVLEIAAPADLRRYVVEKGSIAVAGVSLTVSALTSEGFEIWLIPHTCAVTTLGALPVGARVNLEIDILAKYVERLLGAAERRPGEQESAATMAVQTDPLRSS